ncbi:hypothetical protein BJ878DRAFT_524228 [Calycina marina]|uniref:DUF221-domain-containing protein n=1 Tax=Calycina marina TaxID=1763456 RepID=A0A9P7YW61_9HELO|nr:hypothetical protein BJ878DRAFT_524228 [Calycina marina]
MQLDIDNAGSGTSNSQSSSASAMLATLIPVGLLAVVFITVFNVLRRKFPRVYHPRTFLGTLKEQEKSQSLPDNKIGWLSVFKAIPDEFVLEHQSLDGYLYLRFLKMITIICFVGVCITWPILLPINATGGAKQHELDILNFGNISAREKARYYAHTIVAWIFFSFIMFVITRETIYFINLRQAYLLAPYSAARISSKTVLFTDVPKDYLNSENLKRLFGSTLVRFWKATDTSELESEVEKRDSAAFKLEAAEISLSKKANDRRIKWNKGRQDPTGDEEAALASKFLEKRDRPTHRLSKIPFVGKKVDTIEWTRSELKTLIPKVHEIQLKHQKEEGKLLPAVFVEFTTQHAAQVSFRRMTPRFSPHMNPRAISITPKEIIWENLKIGRKAKWNRKALAITFVVLLIIFWSIPVSIIGAISNINYLTDKVPWLAFIKDLPPKILGAITGLLPSLLLSALVMLVPIIFRFVSKLSGEISFPAVELECQSWHMAFQVIQVFLITTFSSGAAAATSQLLQHPESAHTLLAENLPKASNFYISYFIVQGLGIAASNILNIWGLATLHILGRFLDKSPRNMFERYVTLTGLGWGSLYPKFGNLGIIAVTYSIISPLVLGFAAVGFGFVYLATRYNTLYVLTNNVDTRGAAYARALQHLMIGVYLAELCLIGLFAINTAPGPVALMVIFLVLTVSYHVAMNQALGQLTVYLPETFGDRDNLTMFTSADVNSYNYSVAGVPPSEAAPARQSAFQTKISELLSRFFSPYKFSSFHKAKALMPTLPLPKYTEEEEKLAYFNPIIRSEPPKLWIVRDEMGISAQECSDTSESVEVSDEYASFDSKGQIVWDRDDLDQVPIWEKKIDY